MRVRGKVRHQAFHGATELIRVECADGLVLDSAHSRQQRSAQRVLSWSSLRADAVLVRESPEENLMFSRAYKAGGDRAAAALGAVFLLAPYC